MDGDFDQYERVCRGEFAEIRALLKRIDTTLRGTGNEPGLAERMRLLERAERSRRRAMWLLIGSAATAVAGAVGVIVQNILTG